MRHTLSVATAVCLLALGQYAWSEAADQEVALRAQCAAMALPDDARACADRLLHELEADPTPERKQQSLRWSTLFQATSEALHHHYSTRPQSHLRPHPLLPTGYGHPKEATSLHGMVLETTVVQRWLTRAWG